MKARPAISTDSRPPAAGVIRGDVVYRKAALQRELGWKEHALRQAKAAGLPFICFGREKYILGSDVLAFFERLKKRPSDTRTDDQQQNPAGNGGNR